MDLMRDAEAFFARGAAALEAGEFANAEQLFGALVRQHPRLHAGWNALAVTAIRAGEPALAESRARRALEFDRRNPLYLNNLGVALGELGRFDEAEAALRRALKLKPAYPEGLFNLGKVLHKKGLLVDALRAYERAYAMDCEFPGLRLALAVMYQLHARPARALELMHEFPRLDEPLAPYYADVLGEAEGAEQALSWMQLTLAAHHDWNRLRYSLALALLASGRWREGWAAYQSRPSVPARVVEMLPQHLDGKRVALRAEQGLGDTLFFLRFASALEERGARLTLECPDKLAPALRGSGVADVRPAIGESSFDYTFWIGDLPRVLGSEKTPPAFGLKAGEAPRLDVLGPAPYLAITWRAGTDTLRQREHGSVREALSKAVDLRLLGEALRGWQGTVLALQRNPGSQEIDALSRHIGAPVHDLSMLNEDLPAMVGALDAVHEYVAVSNTNVHLRAGLGKPSRVLIPYPADWRWMREGERSPWFADCPIYRQPASRDWAEPLGRLRTDLKLD
jgi:tetratricopeptide (TPR) repeat protein